jgi:nicotinate-nucleotide adenylyltransferase
MRIGLYGGSFDPIHHGHLILARQALEQLGLAKVIFIPAAESPFKSDHTVTPAQDRLRMAQLAVAPEPQFEVDPIEIARGAPSYTIETARAYRRKYPGDELLFLIGEDHLPTLPAWNDFLELDQTVQFAVLTRSDLPLRIKYPIVRWRFDLSATEIRNRVACGLPITYLVPEVVLRYIQQKQLYRGGAVSKRRS